LGKLGGFGARLAARFLPSVLYDASFELSASAGAVTARALSMFNEIGQPVAALRNQPEQGLLAAVVGSGRLNLNPTLVQVRIEPAGSGSKVTIRAVAKEGLVRQDSAKQAVERIKDWLQK